MKLSISNIAWDKEDDDEMYEYITKAKFDAIEVAPTRIIEKNPYNNIEEAKKFATELKKKYNLNISSIQSIWFGKQEKIFGSIKERKELINYSKLAIDFAKTIKCENLVFGCPKNRVINNLDKEYIIALKFFEEIGNYAKSKNVKFSIEPNPLIYNTNFITETQEAFNIVKEINNEGIAVNLDIGTMIQNNEDINIIENNIKYINHVHLSEPNLELIKQRNIHIQIINLLKKNNYNGYISIEMKKQNNIQKVKETINYVNKIIYGGYYEI